METTPPKSAPTNSFGAWTPPEPDEPEPDGAPASPEAFAGTEPADAAAEAVRIEATEKPNLRRVTLRQKEMVIRRILSDFAERGLDLATIRQEDCAQYRAYLRALADDGQLSLDYCSHLVRSWNATVRAIFGETGKPGEGLVMRGFKQRPKKVEHVTTEEMERIVRAIPDGGFRTRHHQEAFRTYLETAWATGARVGSLLKANLRVEDVDWENQTLRLRHMKNMDEHTAILTPRAAVALKRWCDRLAGTPAWRGAETAVFVDENGRPLTPQWVNRALKRVAATAGVRKPLTTHVIRKSVGTLIGRENPKLAQLQLGISAEIFNRHYNQPLLEDRMAKRDLLPGADWTPTSPEEIAGTALLGLLRGELRKDGFEHQVSRARELEDLPGDRPTNHQGYV